MSAASRVLIVGATGGSHVGGSFLRAAAHLRIAAYLCDTADAWRLGTFGQKLAWHLAGRRPLHLRSFSRSVLNACREFNPTVVLTTGRAPVDASVLRECRASGVKVINFSTDDPFNRSMHSPWFLQGLSLYDVIFTPRRVNLTELRSFGCREVRYLRFGYDPSLFFSEECNDLDYDLFFAGHVERSRADLINSAIAADLSVRLYGTGWEKYPLARQFAAGQANINTVRREARACRSALCVVRRDNRDGHSMRTFELAASGACMIVEETADHLEIFGEDGDAVIYFRNSAELLHHVRVVASDARWRRLLQEAVHARITGGANTYGDRLQTMLDAIA